ncbi:hypothetical protein BaRGS_00009305 [Batillaria attramentaria]|uniref:Uncharacterized protein n=1 Tax=Batillaria attramentaria TaxID=370345 RepID=A0ABD0LIR7_9CAEN
MSSKGKTPWMEYNGQAVADSQFCIEHLKSERGLDLSADLSPLELAQARAFREMTEENLYWTMCYELFVKHPERLGDVMLMRGVLLWIVRLVLGRAIKKELWGHGMGRHTDSEIWDIGRRDLNAVADFLGDKKFFCGDQPTEVDCAMFGMLSQILFHMVGSRHEQHVRENLPNIVAYVERMKAKFWPDWEQRCRGANYVDDSYTLFPPLKA